MSNREDSNMEIMESAEQQGTMSKQRRKKIDDVLLKAQQCAQQLISHRKQASENSCSQKGNSTEQKGEMRSKRKHDIDSQAEIAKEEKQISRKSTGGSERTSTYLTVQPKPIQFGVLKTYQMQGLNWLIQLYELKMNGILADDMGLGKTIQTISLIAFLKQFKNISGKFIVLCPLATLNNWYNEFTRWMPSCRAVLLYATEEERTKTIKESIKTDKYDVILTSYEGIKKSQVELMRVNWEYLIVDEAHKLKNEASQLSILLRQFKVRNRLLLTGTPLQNNIHELMSLLNFVMPSIFNEVDLFDELLVNNSKKQKKSAMVEEEEENNDETENQVSEEDLEKMQLISKLHQIIKPFMLRRTKEDSLKDLPPKKEIHLYVGLSDIQIKMYRNILLNKSIDSIYRGNTDSHRSFNNMLMQLRKVCVHPYLFDGVEDRSLPENGEHLVLNSGKMVVLDKLLKKLSAEADQAHQVLIFSQFTSCLDILEDYLIGRKWDYCRIDGSTEVEEREEMMKEFQADGSKKFVFLLSTRAGGLGINLTKANFVVIFDSDFNPQMDLQAMDRAYRIGQTREVKVLRLITQYTVEEKIIERQTIKLKLDQLIVQSGRAISANLALDNHSMKTIAQYGANEIFKATSSTITDEDIDMIFAKGEKKRNEVNQEIDSLLSAKTKGLFDLEVKGINCKEFFGEDPRLQDEIALKQAALQAELDDKKKLYQEQFKKSKQMVVKQISLPEHHLYTNRKRLEELMQKEEEYIAKGGLMYKMGHYSEDFLTEMANNNGLNSREVEEKRSLQENGFPYWEASDYKQFLAFCYRYGRNDLEKLRNVLGKPLSEVKAYSDKFFVSGDKLISNFSYIIKKIDATEKQLVFENELTNLVKWKMDGLKDRMSSIQFDQKLYKKVSSPKWTLERDQLLILLMHHIGYTDWPRMMFAISTHPNFLLDETIRMMKESDIKIRLKQLVNVIKSENDAYLLEQKRIVELEEEKLQEEKKKAEEKLKEDKKEDKKKGKPAKPEPKKAEVQKEQQPKEKPAAPEQKKGKNAKKVEKQVEEEEVEDDIEESEEVEVKSNKRKAPAKLTARTDTTTKIAPAEAKKKTAAVAVETSKKATTTTTKAQATAKTSTKAQATTTPPPPASDNKKEQRSTRSSVNKPELNVTDKSNAITKYLKKK